MANSSQTDESGYDVIVVGGGVAGMAAAIVAADGGARVALLERTPTLGGMVPYSGGNLLEMNGPHALDHMRALSYGRTDEAVMDAYVAGLHRLEPWLQQLGATTSDLPESGPGSLSPCWPNTPGAEGVRYYRVDGPDGAAPALLDLLTAGVRSSAVEVRTDSRVTKLLMSDGVVEGVVASSRTGETQLTAPAVILATGGFENDPALCDAFLPIATVRAIGHQGNTGDGLRLASDAGAALWHMSNFFGGWSFVTPEYPAAFGVRVGEPGSLIVDATGRRFFAEQGREGHDQLRALGDYLPEGGSYPAWPAWLITDEAGLAEGRLSGGRTSNDYEWTGDNRAEVERGWIRAAASTAELADGIGAEPEVLAATLDAFAESARSGVDTKFGRPGATMRPLGTGGLFAIQLTPAVWTTCGGPRRDELARVVDPFGEPITGLFAAGGNGSIWGHLTEHGGGLTDGLVFGPIAARTALRAMAVASATGP